MLSKIPMPRCLTGACGALLLLLLLGLALDLPGQRSLPVTDRDEARYVQASKQMVETGDYLRIRFLNEARNKKPAGIYWLQAAAVKITGVKDAIWPYRLVSVAGALVALCLVYLLGRRLLPEAPLLPAVALAVSPLLVIVAHAATTDAVLLAVTCLAQGCLASIYLAGRRGNAATPAAWGTAMGFWLAQGLGILVKGPVTPLISGLTILALCLHDRQVGWLHHLRPAWGVPLLLALVVPWLVAIQHATGGAFLRESLGQDFAGKIQGGQEMHGAPPGAYLLTAGLLFWPLFPVAWRGIGQAWRVRRRDPVARFLLAWLIPAWLVFELAPTKLPHYVLPLYPALAFLAVRWLGVEAPAPEGVREAPPLGMQTRAQTKPTFGGRLWGFTCLLADAGWFVAAALFAAGPILAGRLLGWRWMPAAFLCAALAVVAAVFFRRAMAGRTRQGCRVCGARVRMVAVAAGFAVLFFGLLFAGVLPRLDDLWLTRRVAALVRQQAEARGRPANVLSIGYAEPSLAFALGSSTRLNAPLEEVMAALRMNPDAIVLVQDRAPPPPQLLPVGVPLWARLADAVSALPKQCCRQEFLAAAAQAGIPVREVATADGLNYSRTKRLRVTLYMRAGGTP